MAKLKVCDNAGNLLPNGYINIVDQLISAGTCGTNFQDFLDAEPDERADILQDLVKIGLGGNLVVTQQKLGVTPPQIAIDSSNCRIIAQNDSRVQPRKKRTRITVPFPDTPVVDFTYLEFYVKEILKLYTTAYTENTAANKLLAYKFMFGAMMLTRCR